MNNFPLFLVLVCLLITTCFSQELDSDSVDTMASKTTSFKDTNQHNTTLDIPPIKLLDEVMEILHEYKDFSVDPEIQRAYLLTSQARDLFEILSINPPKLPSAGNISETAKSILWFILMFSIDLFGCFVIVFSFRALFSPRVRKSRLAPIALGRPQNGPKSSLFVAFPAITSLYVFDLFGLSTYFLLFFRVFSLGAIFSIVSNYKAWLYGADDNDSEQQYRVTLTPSRENTPATTSVGIGIGVPGSPKAK